MPISPYRNDPNAIVRQAFRHLFPGHKYKAEYVIDLRGQDGTEISGQTYLHYDGTATIQISASLPIYAAVETLCHELAHVATPHDADHGPDWLAAYDQILCEYDRLCHGGRTIRKRRWAKA